MSNKKPIVTMSDQKKEDKEMSWGERCSYKLDMVLSRLDRIVSMLFHTKAVLTTEEAAMYLGITTGHLYRMVRKFNIPHTRPTNGKIYFSKEELDRWIASRTEVSETLETADIGAADDNKDAEAPMTDMYIN